MNTLIYEMLGRQRYEEMLRTAESDSRFASTRSVRETMGDALIRVGRGIERTGEWLTGTTATSAAAAQTAARGAR